MERAVLATPAPAKGQSTMICTSCKAPVTSDSLFCTACGASTASGPPAGGTDGLKSSEPALAAANLARLRKSWEVAEAACIEVMRADPNNVNAYSLLGDIYRDQERFTEASQWYRMALDLKPDSPADRVKLAEVEQKAAKTLVEQTPISPSGTVAGTQKLLGASPVNWLRALTIMATVFILGTVVLLASGRIGQRGKVGPTKQNTGLPGPTPSFSSPPAFGTAPPANQRTGVTTAPPNGAGSGQSSGTGMTPSPGMSSEEANLREFVGRQVSSAGNRINSLSIDQRDSRVTISMALGQAVGQDPDSARAAILRQAYELGQRVFAASPKYPRVTITMRMPLGTTGDEPVFMGDIERSAATTPVESPEQLPTLFKNVWWPDALSPTPSQPQVNQ